MTGMSTNKVDLFEFNGYGAISANNKAANKFTLFDLHLSCTLSNKTWNKIVIN